MDVKKFKIVADTMGAVKGVKSFSKSLKGLSVAQKITKVGFKGIGMAMKGMGLGLIIPIVMALVEAFKKNQKITDLMAKVTDVLSKAVGYLVDGFVFALKVIDKLTFGMLNLSGEADGASKSSQDQRNEVRLMEAEQQKITLQYQMQAEKLRQLRDDDSLTMEERMKANDNLGLLLEEQFQKEKANVLYMIEVRQKELAQDEHSIEKKEALINAEIKLAELEERITGQRSEQLTNINSLKREQVSVSKSNTSSVKKEIKTLEEMIEAMEKYKGTLEVTAEDKYNQEKKKLEDDYQKFLDDVRDRNKQRFKSSDTEAGKELKEVRIKYTKNQERLAYHYDTMDLIGRSNFTKSEVDEMIRAKLTLGNKISSLKKLRNAQEEELIVASDEEIELTKKYNEMMEEMEFDFMEEKANINKKAIDKAMSDMMSDAQKEILLTKGKDAKLLALLVDLKGKEETELKSLEDEKIKALENKSLDNEAKVAIEERFQRDIAEVKARFKEEGDLIEEQSEADKAEAQKNRNAQMIDAALSIAHSLVAISASRANKELATLEKQFKDGEITEDQYNKRKNDIEREQAKKARSAALLQIGVDTARGISGAVAAGSGLPFPANLAAIASGVASVLAGIAQASSVLGEQPEVDDVLGDDGGTDADSPTVPTFGAIETDAPPIQAYVVESGVSSAQALQNDLALQATL